MQFFVGGKLSFKNEERSTDVQDIFPYIVIKRMGETRFDSCHPLKMRCQGWLCLVGSFFGGFVALILDLDCAGIYCKGTAVRTPLGKTVRMRCSVKEPLFGGAVSVGLAGR